MPCIGKILMIRKEVKMLKGKHIGLRAVAPKDLRQLMDWRNIPEYRKHFREHRELSMKEQKSWYENFVVNDSRTIMFSIIELKTKKLIGCCGLCYINWIHRNADLSIYIGKNNAYIDEKYAPDAARTLMNYAFNDLNFHRLWTEIYSFDKRKKKFLTKLGFTLDGKHRETYRHDEKWHDSHFYGILRREAK